MPILGPKVFKKTKINVKFADIYVYLILEQETNHHKNDSAAKITKGSAVEFDH